MKYYLDVSTIPLQKVCEFCSENNINAEFKSISDKALLLMAEVYKK